MSDEGFARKFVRVRLWPLGGGGASLLVAGIVGGYFGVPSALLHGGALFLLLTAHAWGRPGAVPRPVAPYALSLFVLLIAVGGTVVWYRTVAPH